MLIKLLGQIVILVFLRAAGGVCSHLLNTKNFLSSESILQLSSVAITDVMTTGNYTRFCDFSLTTDTLSDRFHPLYVLRRLRQRAARDVVITLQLKLVRLVYETRVARGVNG